LKKRNLLITIFTICVLILVITLVYGSTQNGKKLVSEETLMSWNILTYEDLDKIDINDFIKSGNITKESFENADLHILLQNYKELEFNPQSRQYILNNRAQSKVITELEGVRHIALKAEKEGKISSVIFDFQIGEISYSETEDIIVNTSSAEIQIFEETDKERLLQITKDSIADWKYEYKRGKKDAADGFEWILVIEFENHEIYRYQGYSTIMKKPYNLNEFITEVWKFTEKY